MSIEQQLFKRIWSFRDDPLGFAHYVFPWEKIEPLHGLEDWQEEFLTAIREPGRYAIASGHGIGKGALISIVINWFMSTRYNPSIVVTANTAEQLSAKTWKELGIWHQRAINSHWFDWTATRFSLKANPGTHFAHAIPWSLNRPEGIQGTHAPEVLFIIDEASFIPQIIWEAIEGAMVVGRCWFIVLGNPTRRGTPFEACFSSPYWKTWEIDSRTCKRTNQYQIQAWIDEYGEDSDFVRVRVKGKFPKQAIEQFISEAAVDAAWGRSIDPSLFMYAPRILSIDPARFGNNATAIIKKQGLAAFDLERHYKKDTVFLAGHVGEIINKWKPDAVNIDSGMGGGLIDLLRGNNFIINEIVSGGSSPNSRFLNLRMYAWDQMKQWLPGGSIPADKLLKAEIIAPQYHFTPKGKMVLEGKEAMEARHILSPDGADALANCFAVPVQAKHKIGQHRVKKTWDVAE